MAARGRSMYEGNRLILGFYGSNCSSGIAVTTVPERWEARWDNEVALARMADDAGIEFLLPVGRWKGYGGKTNFEGTSFETITWACGLLANTSSIAIFGTVHVPLVHPIFAAKQMITAHHIGEGRFGLNVVCGWNQSESDMFAIPQREHDARYDYGQEWLDVVRQIWSTEGSFDYKGQFLELTSVCGEPKPYEGVEPILMNAGFSSAGREFAARNCDFLFTVTLHPGTAKADIAKVKKMAAKYDRDVRCITTAYVVCRPTVAEAEEYHHYYVDECADWDAVDRLMELQGISRQEVPGQMFEMLRRRFAGGHGLYPIVGDPDSVTNELEKLSSAGFVGTTVSFVNYLAEFPYFRDEVLPRLEAAGLRKPV